MTRVFDNPPRWSSLAHDAFWDRQVSQEDWRKGFLAGSASYLPQTLKSIEPRHAIALMGKAAFVQAWPSLRVDFLERHPEWLRRVRKWDVYWSLAATGTLDVRPLPSWAKLPRRTKEFLLYVAKHQGTSIYAVAKGLAMTYRRAHDHARRLTDLGFLRSTLDTAGPRRKVILYAAQDVRMPVDLWERSLVSAAIASSPPSAR